MVTRTGSAAEETSTLLPETGLQRVCFMLLVKPDRLDEYRKRHQAVWPEMLQALHDAGWRNYSLFLREDGLLVGYLETPNLERSLELLDRCDANRRWQAQMAEFFVGAPGRRADQQMSPLREIFHLE